MSTFNRLRDATIENCKLICKYMQQDVSLWEQKYKRIISDVEDRTDNVAYLSPEQWIIKVYNESVNKLDQFKPLEIVQTINGIELIRDKNKVRLLHFDDMNGEWKNVWVRLYENSKGEYFKMKYLDNKRTYLK